MNLIKLATRTKKMVSDNSPVILTAIGVTGTITTAYLAAKASFKAADTLRYEGIRRVNAAAFEREANIALRPTEVEGVDDLQRDTGFIPPKEQVGLVWKYYVPAAVTGVMTCTCIIAASYIGTRRAAALAAAYSLSERALAEYRDKVIERLGEDEHESIRQDIAQDRVDRTAPDREVLFVTDGNVLCHDGYSGRYFMSDKERLRRAANDIAYQVLHSDYATLSDFYDKVGLDSTSVSEEMGWNTENQIELLFSTVETPDGQPCLSYDFAVVPIREPWRFR